MKVIKRAAYVVAFLAFVGLYYIANLSDADALTLGEQLWWTIPLMVIMAGSAFVGLGLEYLEANENENQGNTVSTQTRF